MQDVLQYTFGRSSQWPLNISLPIQNYCLLLIQFAHVKLDIKCVCSIFQRNASTISCYGGEYMMCYKQVIAWLMRLYMYVYSMDMFLYRCTDHPIHARIQKILSEGVHLDRCFFFFFCFLRRERIQIPLNAGHNRPAIERRFASGTMMALHWMLAW